MLCPKPCIVCNWLKRALPQSHIGRKYFYLEIIIFIMIFFCEGSIKVTHSKKKNNKFWDVPTWDVPTTNQYGL
jgi:hypothetical protein